MFFLTLLACTSDDTGDSGIEADTGTDTGTDTGESAGDTEETGDTGPRETGETGSDPAPEYVFVAGPTGIQLDFSSSLVPVEGEMIRCGVWGDIDFAGQPDAFGETPAVFPSSLVMEVPEGGWYTSAFFDLGGNSPTGPGAEDITARWEAESGIAYQVEVRDGFTTTGLSLTFE